MPVGEHEPVPVGPDGVGGVVAQLLLPELVGHGRQRHGRPRVARMGLFHRVHGEGAEGVDALPIGRIVGHVSDSLVPSGRRAPCPKRDGSAAAFRSRCAAVDAGGRRERVDRARGAGVGGTGGVGPGVAYGASMSIEKPLREMVQAELRTRLAPMHKAVARMSQSLDVLEELADVIHRLAPLASRMGSLQLPLPGVAVPVPAGRVRGPWAPGRGRGGGAGAEGPSGGPPRRGGTGAQVRGHRLQASGALEGVLLGALPEAAVAGEDGPAAEGLEGRRGASVGFRGGVAPRPGGVEGPRGDHAQEAGAGGAAEAEGLGAEEGWQGARRAALSCSSGGFPGTPRSSLGAGLGGGLPSHPSPGLEPPGALARPAGGLARVPPPRGVVDSANRE